MSKKQTRSTTPEAHVEEHPIDPKTGRPKAAPADRKPKRTKRDKGAETSEKPSQQRGSDLVNTIKGVPVLGSLVSLVVSLPLMVQRGLWLGFSGVMAWAMVQLLVVTMPSVIGYTEQNVMIMLTGSVFAVAVAPILLTRNWHHLLRPLAVTALVWAVYPDLMPFVLFIGLIRIFNGEIATTSLWPSSKPRGGESSFATKRA